MAVSLARMGTAGEVGDCSGKRCAAHRSLNRCCRNWARYDWERTHLSTSIPTRLFFDSFPGNHQRLCFCIIFWRRCASCVGRAHLDQSFHHRVGRAVSCSEILMAVPDNHPASDRFYFTPRTGSVLHHLLWLGTLLRNGVARRNNALVPKSACESYPGADTPCLSILGYCRVHVHGESTLHVVKGDGDSIGRRRTSHHNGTNTPLAAEVASTCSSAVPQ